ncbi:MAG: hypothetical protein ACXV3D_09630 [Halobacteriota archaeon]
MNVTQLDAVRGQVVLDRKVVRASCIAVRCDAQGDRSTSSARDDDARADNHAGGVR